MSEDRRKLRAWGAEVVVADWDSASGSGSPVVVLHSEEGPRTAQAVVDGLRESDRVLAFTHPGFDRRPRLAGADRPHDLAYIYLDLLDELGVTECQLVGSSLGAWIALEMAVMEPRRFASVTAIGPVGAKFGGRTDRSFAEVLVAAPDRIASTLYADVANNPWRDRTETDDVVERFEYRESFMHYVWEPYLHNPRLPALLPRIAAPVLVVAGGADQLVGPDYYEQLVAQVPDGRLERIPDCGHFPEIERAGETVELIRKFHSGNGAALDSALTSTLAGQEF